MTDDELKRLMEAQPSWLKTGLFSPSDKFVYHEGPRFSIHRDSGSSPPTTMAGEFRITRQGEPEEDRTPILDYPSSLPLPPGPCGGFYDVNTFTAVFSSLSLCPTYSVTFPGTDPDGTYVLDPQGGCEWGAVVGFPGGTTSCVLRYTASLPVAGVPGWLLNLSTTTGAPPIFSVFYGESTTGPLGPYTNQNSVCDAAAPLGQVVGATGGSVTVTGPS